MKTANTVNNIQQALERKRKRFFAALPQRITCNCCSKSKPKEKFGVRLMNGAEVLAGKAEPIFRVQSYCLGCRS